MMGDAEGESELAVLVCSANIGNAEPTPESFHEWVPDDGEIEGPLSQTKYAVEADGAADVRASLRRGKKFDIIVLGMQEAAFAAPNEKRGSKVAASLDFSGRETEHVDAARGKVSDMKEKGRKSKDGFLRRIAKAQLLRRGLGMTTSENYQAPTSCGRSNRKISRKSEREYSAEKSSRHDSRTFLGLIANRCPSYSIISNNMRGEIRLIVLALEDLSGQITDLYAKGENTGIGGVMANKGGIIATFNLRGTRLSFMTAHLAAHEGATYYANRNKNLAEIFNGAKTDPNYDLYDATIISHHIFVCGDLNYRIKFGELEEEKKKNSDDILESITDKTSVGKEPVRPDSEEPRSANGTHFAQAKAFVDAEDWKALNDGDELTTALAKKDCLVGFTTLRCHFPPTFKVERGEGYQYNNKRTPSYTDRILWKSAHGMSNNVVPFLYEPCPGFKTSDHKPVRGGYLVKTNKGQPGQLTSNSFKDSNRQVHLLVSDMTCTNLPALDLTGGQSDPYILFVSYPKSILWENGWPSTNVMKRNLNPVWEQDIHVTLDGDGRQDDKGHVSFNGCMLYMTVMDKDFVSTDDLIGTVALSFTSLCSELAAMKEHDHSSVVESAVSTSILRDGQEHGMLECTITAAYLTKKEVGPFLSRSKRIVRSKKKKRRNFLGVKMNHRASLWESTFQY